MHNSKENKWLFELKNAIRELINFLPILTLLTLFSGIFIAYYHLHIIDKVSIFPEVIGQTQSYIAIIFGNAILLICYFLYFVILLMLISGLHNKFKEVKIRGKVILFVDFIIIATFPFILEYYIQKFSSENHAKYYFIAVVFIVYFALNIFLHSINKENLFRLSDTLIISLFLTIFSMCHFIVQTEMVDTNLNSTYFSLYIAIFIIFQVFGIEFLGEIKLLENKNNQMLLVCVFSFIFLFYGVFYSNSLTFFHFIEKPQDSSWYLIHNGNTTSENINGLSKTEIQNLKHEFKPKNKDDENIENPNALYGYMAWNLGNTKVFCPQSVDFFDDKGNNKEKSAKCLVIDGKYLQLVSKHYLAK